MILFFFLILQVFSTYLSLSPVENHQCPESHSHTLRITQLLCNLHHHPPYHSPYYGILYNIHAYLSGNQNNDHYEVSIHIIIIPFNTLLTHYTADNPRLVVQVPLELTPFLESCFQVLLWVSEWNKTGVPNTKGSPDLTFFKT